MRLTRTILDVLVLVVALAAIGLMLQRGVGWAGLSVGDVNYDGDINALDALLILQYDSNLIDGFGTPPGRTATPVPSPTVAPTPTPEYSAIDCQAAALNEVLAAVRGMAFGTRTLIEVREAAQYAAAICLNSPLVECGEVIAEGILIEYTETSTWARRVQEICDIPAV